MNDSEMLRICGQIDFAADAIKNTLADIRDAVANPLKIMANPEQSGSTIN